MYSRLRTIHLVCGAFAFPMLLMYAISAVQMAHGKWFDLKPTVTERQVKLSRGFDEGRMLANELMASQGLRGEINSVQATASGLTVRIVIPGTVHEILYERDKLTATVRTSVAGTLGMLNRLHHAAGFWHDYGPLKLWAALVALASSATVCLAVTGIWMWWLRRQERRWGLILLIANLTFSIVVLGMLRLSSFGG